MSPMRRIYSICEKMKKERHTKIKKLKEKLVGLQDNMHDNFEEIEKLQTELESEI